MSALESQLARRAAMVEKKLQARVEELEHKLSQVLDAAQTMEARLPDRVEVTIRDGWAERGRVMYEQAQDYGPEVHLTFRAPELDEATRQSIGQNLEWEVHRLGDWSTLREREKHITKLEAELREREADVRLLLDFAEFVVARECEGDNPRYPGSPAGSHSLAEQRAAYRVGGRDALLAVVKGKNPKKEEAA